MGCLDHENKKTRNKDKIVEDKDEGASGRTLTFPVLSVHDQSIKATNSEKKKQGQ